MFRLVLATGLSTVLVASLVACGGGSKKVKDPKSGGTVSYEDGAQANNDTPPDTQEPSDTQQPPDPQQPESETPEPEQPKPTPKVQPKPPGEDLTPAEKAKRIDASLREGQDATKREDAEKMITAAKDILDIDQANVDAMVMLAHGYFLKGLDDKAEGVLEEAKKRAPDVAPKNAKLWMILGLIYDRSTRANHDDLALMAYSSAIQFNAKYSRAYTNRGVIYLQRKAYVLESGGGAVSDFETVDELELGSQLDDGDRASCKCKAANTCTHLGAAYRGLSAAEGQSRDPLLQRAERCFKNSNSVNPAYAPAYFNLGLLYLDADPFPGLDKLKRLEQAKLYFNMFKTKAGSAIKPAEQDAVDKYIATAQKSYEGEQKLQEIKRKREEDKKRKEAEKKAKEKEKPAGGGEQ